MSDRCKFYEAYVYSRPVCKHPDNGVKAKVRIIRSQPPDWCPIRRKIIGDRQHEIKRIELRLHSGPRPAKAVKEEMTNRITECEYIIRYLGG